MVELNKDNVKGLVGKEVVGVIGHSLNFSGLRGIVGTSGKELYNIEYSLGHGSCSYLRIFPRESYDHGTVIELDENKKPVEIYEF